MAKSIRSKIKRKNRSEFRQTLGNVRPEEILRARSGLFYDWFRDLVVFLSFSTLFGFYNIVDEFVI
jgi:hypothetical protein